MSVFEHGRYKIFNNAQHPYQHTISDYGYINSRLPGVTNLNEVLDYIVASIYPNWKGTVATTALLPLTATANDYYVVSDDGDGKSAGYVWSVIDNVAQWIKRYDVDWSFEGILAEAVDSTRHVYVHKYGFNDLDENALPFVGDLAGQHIYGGSASSSNLTFHANSGDLAGHTGYVQFDDNIRPLVHNVYSLGTNLYRFSDFYTQLAKVGTLSFSGGSINDSSGALTFHALDLTTTGNINANTLGILSSATVSTLSFGTGSISDSTGNISFSNENLSTSGTLASGTHTISSSLVLAAGSITSGTGNITFDNENLSTSGTLGCGALTATSASIDDLFLNANTLSVQTLDTNLNLIANGTGIINLQSAMQTLGQTVTGTVGITGQLNVDNIRIDANTISSQDADGNINILPNGAGYITSKSIFPTTDNNYYLGDVAKRFKSIYLTEEIRDGVNVFTLPELMQLRSTVYRDVARTLPAQTGDTLFYDAVNDLWLANHPDTEILHSEISGLTSGDAGHTQFALLAGRAGGQTLKGGTAASENLILESTAHATKGDIFAKDDLLPFTNASYSGGWSGIDLGDSTHFYRDIYSKGEHKNLRVENFTFASLPASSATSKGRLTFATDTNAVYVDTGSAQKIVGGNKFVSDVSFDGVVTVKNVDVSSQIADARNTTFTLLDNNNNFEKMFVKMEATSASNIRITTNIALPIGSYRLIVME